MLVAAIEILANKFKNKYLDFSADSYSTEMRKVLNSFKSTLEHAVDRAPSQIPTLIF